MHKQYTENGKYDTTFWEKTGLCAICLTVNQVSENGKLCQCMQISLYNKAYICWRYKYAFTTKSIY